MPGRPPAVALTNTSHPWQTLDIYMLVYRVNTSVWPVEPGARRPGVLTVGTRVSEVGQHAGPRSQNLPLRQSAGATPVYRIADAPALWLPSNYGWTTTLYAYYISEQASLRW